MLLLRGDTGAAEGALDISRRGRSLKGGREVSVRYKSGDVGARVTEGIGPLTFRRRWQGHFGRFVVEALMMM